MTQPSAFGRLLLVNVSMPLSLMLFCLKLHWMACLRDKHAPSPRNDQDNCTPSPRNDQDNCTPSPRNDQDNCTSSSRNDHASLQI